MSAPSIPGLLSLDPIGDPTSLLSSLTMGTEVEVQFGKSLQVSTLLSHKQNMSQVQTMADSCVHMVLGKFVQVCVTSMVLVLYLWS